jgi:hypothetical protein
MIEDGTFLPGERSTVLTIIPLAVKALVEGIEKTSIEDFVEAFEEFKLVFEYQGVGLVVVVWDLDYDGLLLHGPEGIEDSVRYDHHVRLVLIFFFLFLHVFFTRLMHVS